MLACKNEEEFLETSFQELLNTLRLLNRSFEIVLVDDVSQDRTRSIIDRLV